MLYAIIHWNTVLLVIILYCRLSIINHTRWHGRQPRSKSSGFSLKCPFVVSENFGHDHCTALGQGHICWQCIWVEPWPWVLSFTWTRSHCCHIFSLQLLFVLGFFKRWPWPLHLPGSGHICSYCILIYILNKHFIWILNWKLYIYVYISCFLYR